MTEPRPGSMTSDESRKHRRIAYRVQLNRPFRHSEDTDIIDGVYSDGTNGALGPILLPSGDHDGRALLVLPEEDIPLIHVEAAMDNDHRVDSFEQVFGLLYDPDEPVPGGVGGVGDRWDAGDLIVYTFESDEDAVEAQGS